jgi:hypothetical protein
MYSLICEIGKFVPALTAQDELENIYEQALIMKDGLQTLKQELQSLDTEGK